MFESLVAAIYLDGGDPAAREFLERHIGPEIELAAGGELGNNYKSMLQQLAQREHGTTPTYQLLDEKGPDHSKCFKIAAQVGKKPVSGGLGSEQEGSRATRCTQRLELKCPACPSPRLRNKPSGASRVKNAGI